MSKIDDLIAELAPEGVKYQRIGDVAQIGTGSSDRKDASADGEYPFYVRSKDVLRIDSYEFDEEAILIPGEGGIGEIFHFVSGKYALHQRAYRISFRTPDIDTKFAYYVFSVHFKKFILQKAVSATVISIRKPMISDFRIPVPPLVVQREIVRILDRFAQLTAKLEAKLAAELEARRRQYEHYRNELLGFTADRSQVAIAELIHGVSSGRNKFRVEGGAFPVFGSTGPIGTTDTPVYSEEALLVARVGANAGRVNAVCGEYDVSDNTLIVSPKSGWDLRFAYHQLTHMNLNQYAVGGGQPLVTGRLIKTLEVVAPPLEEQRRIASLLDKFDALVNDLSIGLLAERAARRKQYEYSRDKLLTFEESAV